VKPSLLADLLPNLKLQAGVIARDIDMATSPAFELAPCANTVGIIIVGEIDVAPALLVRRFGLPLNSDGYKISGEYVFVDKDGRPFVIHDWKSTSLWDKTFPTPEQFWANGQPEELSIGTRGLDPTEFKRWLFKQLAAGATDLR
jgi:hypothetical protein